MKKLALTLALVVLFVGIGQAQGTTPEWIETSLTFDVSTTAPTANCDGSPLNDLARVELVRRIDGGAEIVIADISPILPGQVVVVSQTVPHESENVEFRRIAYDTVGNSSDDCDGGCPFVKMAVRIAPACGTGGVGPAE